MMSSYLKKCALVVALSSVFPIGAMAGTLIIEEGSDALLKDPPVSATATSVALPVAEPATQPMNLGASVDVIQQHLKAAAQPQAVTPQNWVVNEVDSSVFNVLMVWAKKAEWTFRLDHWTVPNDYPVQGGASFEGDFKTAVRDLLDTTRQSALPVQPCFYSNKVLRVVPRSELCDRALISTRSN